MNSPQLYAIVLAAGKSVRFGSLKQLTPFNNKPLVSHVVTIAEKTCQSNSILVTGKNWKKVYKSMENPKIIFDGKNFLNQKLIQDLGFEYFAVGRKIKNKK